MSVAVFISDWKTPLSNALEERIRGLIGKDKPLIGYIPSRTDEERRYFYPIKQQFDRLGAAGYVYCDVDKAFDPFVLGNLYNCKAIFLSGGNTFHFLTVLKSNGMIEWLKKYAEDGGVLIGLSAGGMIMTADILAAEFVDAKYLPESSMEKSEYGGIGLADFHFYPHWEGSKNQLCAVEELKKLTSSPVIACPDGSGMVIMGDRFEFYGNLIEF
ncbi:Type 1 glutamine amidotransferase-like domain-containing protein [Thalassobacillus pellis]|uniref:Type 1 glutamine amidotransferase-like domain-containing protein n=1 Tax=Thalassobacillus pellis TaxID=748008 RepID=UPI0019621818|nr:Type 1 glutamine amidotransferase-like domain-containing protein [Thalassobacillus pellis]MBM7554338.1 dipeptidase E [Thalassobacillus pellis]